MNRVAESDPDDPRLACGTPTDRPIVASVMHRRGRDGPRRSWHDVIRPQTDDPNLPKRPAGLDEESIDALATELPDQDGDQGVQ